MWCIGIINGEYLANMEDILDLYAQPQEEGIVRLCFDERRHGPPRLPAN